MFSWGYMCLKSAGAASSSTEYVADVGDIPILVGKDRIAKWIIARVVKRKGDDPYTVKRVSIEVGF